MIKTNQLIGALLLFCTIMLSACREGQTVDCAAGITTPTTWRHTDQNAYDYYVSCNLEVTSTLTILPGTNIRFAPGAGIMVKGRGFIATPGEAGNTNWINMVGQVSSGGDPNDLTINTRLDSWRGIHFAADNTGSSLLNKVYISRAGPGNRSANTDAEAAIVVDGGRHRFLQLFIDTTEASAICIANAGLANGTDRTNMNNIRVRSCANWPLILTQNNLLHAFSGYTGELVQNPRVLVKAHRTERAAPPSMSSSQIVNHPLQINEVLTYSSPLNFISSLKAEFSETGGLRFEGDGSGQRVSASAGAELKLLSSITNPATRWQGIKSNNMDALLQGVVIDKAGATAESGAIEISGANAHEQIRGCTISNSNGVGVRFADNVAADNVSSELSTGNTFTNCVVGKVRMPDGAIIP